MSQNSARIAWDEEELRRLLENMMRDIHDLASSTAKLQRGR